MRSPQQDHAWQISSSLDPTSEKYLIFWNKLQKTQSFFQQLNNYNINNNNKHIKLYGQEDSEKPAGLILLTGQIRMKLKKRFAQGQTSYLLHS